MSSSQAILHTIHTAVHRAVKADRDPATDMKVMAAIRALAIHTKLMISEVNDNGES